MKTKLGTSDDTRFFPGYTWCSDSPDCLIGLCMPGTDEAVAAARFSPMRWYDTKPHVVYTKIQTFDVPQRHVITK